MAYKIPGPGTLQIQVLSPGNVMTAPQPDDLSQFLHPAVREIHRDGTLWVLDKPSGIVSHPNPPGTRASNALVRAPFDFERELYRVEPEGGKQRQVHLVHRLDQETSGLILCTLDGSSAAVLKEAFFHREIAKEYRALVVGIPRQEAGEWSDRLEKVSRRGQAVVTVVKGRANAVTRFEVVEVFRRQGLAMLALWPETGRTHQLRVQTASRGFPIAHDERYGDPAANRRLEAEIGLKHMFLHAQRVELRHPRSGHHLRLEAPMSSRLTAPLEKLRGGGVKLPR